MTEHIHKLLEQDNRFSKEEIKEIVELLDIRSFPKGTVLLKVGETAKKCYFILSGYIRQYRLEDGVEKTTAFYLENQSIVPEKYWSGKLSNDYLFSNEEVTAIVGDPANEGEMYTKYPKLESLMLSLVEKDFGKTREEFSDFISSSPEKRYLNLLENRPELLQRAPQHQIASLLGITPESLSRIRKRISKIRD